MGEEQDAIKMQTQFHSAYATSGKTGRGFQHRKECVQKIPVQEGDDTVTLIPPKTGRMPIFCYRDAGRMRRLQARGTRQNAKTKQISENAA